MSIPETIVQTLEALRTRIVDADAIGQTLEAAGGDEPPPWVFVYRSQVGALLEAADALETAVNGHFRGDGGHAPHGDGALADHGSIRVSDAAALPGSSSRLDKQVLGSNC